MKQKIKKLLEVLSLLILNKIGYDFNHCEFNNYNSNKYFRDTEIKPMPIEKYVDYLKPGFDIDYEKKEFVKHIKREVLKQIDISDIFISDSRKKKLKYRFLFVMFKINNSK
ncbi:hypothetical protein [Dysgonomonas sp. 37-18]|uniref:hypothetical protein n=1 Tax=Dysgonomonas sp. 37-18 TaxID=1895907 RepID=UPI0009263AC8|nr:hypothetical protein [Dysgonomonas sp. 37-18]OJX63059.1 MAG: hypothetical protein BGO84_14235 [Dysgonomonas sp. 37-18]